MKIKTRFEEEQEKKISYKINKFIDKYGWIGFTLLIIILFLFLFGSM